MTTKWGAWVRRQPPTKDYFRRSIDINVVRFLVLVLSNAQADYQVGCIDEELTRDVDPRYRSVVVPLASKDTATGDV